MSLKPSECWVSRAHRGGRSISKNSLQSQFACGKQRQETIQKLLGQYEAKRPHLKEGRKTGSPKGVQRPLLASWDTYTYVHITQRETHKYKEIFKKKRERVGGQRVGVMKATAVWHGGQEGCVCVQHWKAPEFKAH